MCSVLQENATANYLLVQHILTHGLTCGRYCSVHGVTVNKEGKRAVAESMSLERE